MNNTNAIEATFRHKILESVLNLLEDTYLSFDVNEQKDISKMLIQMASEVGEQVPEQIQVLANSDDSNVQESNVIDILKSFAKKVIPAFLLSTVLFSPSANAMNIPSQVSMQSGYIQGVYDIDTREYTTKKCNDIANQLTLKWKSSQDSEEIFKDLSQLSGCEFSPVQTTFLQAELDTYENLASKYIDVTIEVVKDAQTNELTDQFSVEINALSSKDSATLENGSSHEAYDLLSNKIVGFKDYITYDNFMNMIKSCDSKKLQDLINKSIENN